MSEEQLRQELHESFKHRAILYYLIFDEMRAELGAEKAEEILSRAIYRRGAQKGKQKYAQFAPNDLAGLKRAFVGSSADGGRLFQPEVLRDDPDGLDVQHHRCPLKEAWQEIGLSDDDVATLCRIAARVDNGTFEAAGFQFSAETWRPGRDGCCLLKIRPGK
ncbi:MAG: L-2-amino-thiazoline-4-carboxylic acid hydrolase [Thermoguttaceae bacterium]|jgi:hypothetical protein